jgi:hypothetical protein
MKSFLYISLSVVFLFISCQGNVSNTKKEYKASTIALEKEDYITWCQNKENPLQKKKEIEDITFSLKYKPAEFVACMEQASGKADTNNLKVNVAELDGLDYYDFKIQITSGQGELLKYKVESSSDYINRVNYFAFDMEKDIKIVDGKDTLSCALFHFERAYDVIPYATFVLAFPKSKSPVSEKTFIYQDRVFNKGVIKFTYTLEDLSQIPKLKTI